MRFSRSRSWQPFVLLPGRENFSCCKVAMRWWIGLVNVTLGVAGWCRCASLVSYSVRFSCSVAWDVMRP
ncbi:hypothetical protein PIB30_064608 [Stylosanthes scabra]|uniref:Uncharacterized protein n=1 Tax=Stylosanthes scabra TaxID=79078 RepID=A0ABU6RM54_9FABA|nr:hypothetical protein [Stylosanthes scabra]